MKPFQQKSAPWGSVLYTSTGNKTQTIGSSGCGLLSLMNAIYALTGGEVKLDPVQLDKWCVDNGFRTANDGTSWGYIDKWVRDELVKYDYTVQHTSDTNVAIQALKDGKVIVTSVHGNAKKLYTSGGHYLAIIGYTDDGYFYIMDSDFYKGKFTVGERPKYVKTNTQTLETWCKPTDFKPEMSGIGYVIIGCNKNINEEEMTMAQLEEAKAYTDQLRNDIQQYLQYKNEGKPASDWAKEIWDKATELKIVDGSNPQSPLTREQFITVLDRLGLVKG